MFVMKLIAFSCILEQANAYQRNEGEKKSGPTEEQYKGMDLISWTLLGYTVSQVQTMYSQNKSEKLYQNNAVLNEFKERILDDTDTSTDEKQFIFFVYALLAKLGSGKISKSQAMAQLDEAYGKMSKDAQDEWSNDLKDFYAYRTGENDNDE